MAESVEERLDPTTLYTPGAKGLTDYPFSE